MKTTCKFISLPETLHIAGCTWPPIWLESVSALSSNKVAGGVPAVTRIAQPSLRLGHTLVTFALSPQKEGKPTKQRARS